MSSLHFAILGEHRRATSRVSLPCPAISLGRQFGFVNIARAVEEAGKVFLSHGVVAQNFHTAHVHVTDATVSSMKHKKSAWQPLVDVAGRYFERWRLRRFHGVSLIHPLANEDVQTIQFRMTRCLLLELDGIVLSQCTLSPLRKVERYFVGVIRKSMKQRSLVAHLSFVYVRSRSGSQLVPSRDNSPWPMMVLPSSMSVPVKRCEKPGAFLHHFQILS